MCIRDRRRGPAAFLEFLQATSREFGVAPPPRREVPWHPAGPGAQEPAPEPGLGRSGSAAGARARPAGWAPRLAGLVAQR
eukprot:10869201-Alexandrium_andersonii.AAC.1